MAGTLCLDFGNSRMKCALFEEGNFKREIILSGGNLQEIDDLLNKYRPEKAILSSVIKHDIAIETMLAERVRFHKLSHNTCLNFTTPVARPETIGADRLALIAAAVHLFPSQNTLVIALGSCITYNFVNQYNQFIGGAISPGMEMRFRSMNHFTEQLPLVQKDWNFPVMGYDTKTNLQSGVLAGITYEIEGFINFYDSKYGNFNVVLTGGDTLYFARRLKNRIFADLNFLFKGLYALSEINNT